MTSDTGAESICEMCEKYREALTKTNAELYRLKKFLERLKDPETGQCRQWAD